MASALNNPQSLICKKKKKKQHIHTHIHLHRHIHTYTQNAVFYAELHEKECPDYDSKLHPAVLEFRGASSYLFIGITARSTLT